MRFDIDKGYTEEFELSGLLDSNNNAVSFV